VVFADERGVWADKLVFLQANVMFEPDKLVVLPINWWFYELTGGFTS
jgi:hypothetical protein